MSSAEQSVTEWIALLKADKEAAAQPLYERYIERLVAAARDKLGDVPRRVMDEEDIAHIAINSFFRGVARKRFPKLNDRFDLWQVLLMLTDRKVIDQKRRLLSQKRGAGGELGESALDYPDRSREGSRGIEQVMGREPTPDFAAMVADEFEQRIQQLNAPVLRRIAIMKMEGRTNNEIAKELGFVTRSVERKLELIRKTWQGA